MSTRYTVTPSDESTAELDADRVDVVSGGALCFARASEPPPAGMAEIFPLNPRSWRWCVADGAAVSFSTYLCCSQRSAARPRNAFATPAWLLLLIRCQIARAWRCIFSP